MNKKLLLEYANLKIQAKEIEAKLEFLYDEALKQVQEIKGDSDQPVALDTLPGYTFGIASRKTWTYSQSLQTKEIDLKTLKATEQATGAATFIEEQQLRFSSPRV
jgi:hypothetical protein